MRFLLHAQLSPRLVRHLRQAGHDALHVFDQIDPSADDLAVAALANQLGASVITKDADFVDLARRGLLDLPLVWLRVPNARTSQLWLRLDSALPDIVAAANSDLRIFEVS